MIQNFPRVSLIGHIGPSIHYIAPDSPEVVLDPCEELFRSSIGDHDPKYESERIGERDGEVPKLNPFLCSSESLLFTALHKERNLEQTTSFESRPSVP